jgi:hypothetical protein
MQGAPVDIGEVLVIWLIPVDVVQMIERSWLIQPKRGGREVHEVEIGDVVGHDWLMILGEKGVKDEAELVESGLAELSRRAEKR